MRKALPTLFYFFLNPFRGSELNKDINFILFVCRFLSFLKCKTNDLSIKDPLSLLKNYINFSRLNVLCVFTFIQAQKPKK